MEVTPPTATLTAGQTQQLAAVPRDASGNVLTGRTISWSSNTAAATVSASGLVTAVSAGTATISALVEGKTGSATITVNAPAAVASVTVSPSSAFVTVGQTQQLTATVRDAAGNVLTGRTVAWSSNRDAAATVSATGLVTAVAAGVGAAGISATVEGRVGGATITPTLVASVSITPATATLVVGQTQQLTATVRDGAGNPLTRFPAWSSSSAAATVSAAGLVTAAAPGEAIITALIDGKTGSSTITVNAPATSTLAACGTITLPGRYLLNADLASSSSRAACLTISGPAVELDCQQHQVSEIIIGLAGNVTGTKITNCDVNTIVGRGGTSVTISNNRVRYVIAGGGSWTIDNNIVGPTLAAYAINVGGPSSNNVITNNTITGVWYPGSPPIFDTSETGAQFLANDDGILLNAQTNTRVEGNIITGFYDAGVEGVGGLTNSVIRNNTISTVGVTGIGAWYSANWQGSTVTGNRVSTSPNLFEFYYLADASHYPIGPGAFINNRFDGNVVTSLLSGGGPTLFTFPSGVEVRDNVLLNNNIGSIRISPAAGFQNGGGNTCQAVAGFPWPGCP